MKRNILRYARSYGLNSVLVLKALKILIVFAAAATVLMTIAYNTLNVSMRKDLMSKNTMELKKTAVLFENFFREAEYLAAKTFINKDVNHFMSLSDAEKITPYQKEKLLDAVNGWSVYNTGVKNVYIYNSKAGCVVSGEDILPKTEFKNEFWFNETENNYTGSYKIAFQKNPDSFLNSIYFIKKAAENPTYVVVELDVYNIKTKLEQNRIFHDKNPSVQA